MASKTPLALYSGTIEEIHSADTLALAVIPTPLTGKDADTLDGQHGGYYAISGGAPTAHALIDATGHTASGLTTGHFLKATGATTYGFGAHGLAYGDVGAAPLSHVHAWGDITSGVPTTWTPIAHDLLSAYHGDTTGGSVVRGDLITGQGASPNTKWVRLVKGTSGYFFKAGADDVGWAAHGLTYSDVGADQSGAASGAVSSHESTYNHSHYNTAYGWGDWHHTTISGYGITDALSNPMTNIGDLIYGGAAGAPTRLADGVVGSYLRGGGVDTAPLWSTLILPNTITVGYIPFASATNTIGSDANLFWDNSNKRLGIGTAAPAYPVDIKGTGIQVRIGNTTSGAQKQVSFVSSDGQVYVGQESNVGANIFTGTSAYAAVFGTNQNYPVELCVAGAMHLSLSYVGNLRLGGVALRNNMEGTNVINVFDGTAPVGTLANGCSIYSASGELYTMDAAGNATQQTPHNKKGEWIFYSKNTVTGKVLQIDMERMMKMLNKRFDGDFVQEYIEQIQN